MKWVLILHVFASWAVDGYERRATFETQSACIEAMKWIEVKNVAYELSCFPEPAN